jgi:hypothetical protein
MISLFTRRNVVIGAGAIIVVAAGGFGGHYLLERRYAPSPYDDLLVLLDDRDADAQIGETVLADYDDFDVKTVADELRARLKRHKLSEVVVRDAADGQLVEANGWVLPQTLGMLCALAAKSAA